MVYGAGSSCYGGVRGLRRMDVTKYYYGDFREPQRLWQGHTPVGKYRCGTNVLDTAHLAGLVEGHVVLDAPRELARVLGELHHHATNVPEGRVVTL